jgi:hypothetical protein
LHWHSWRVPLTAFGDLRVVASADLGELGQREGPAILVRWNALHSLIGWSPWLVLLVLALLPANRTPKLAYLVLVLAAELTLLGFVPEQYDFVHTAFQTLALSIAAIWLVGPVLAPRPRWLAFPILLLMVVLVAVLQGLVYGDPLAAWLAMNFTGRLAIVLGATLSLVLACGLTWSAVCCRKPASLPRLGMWLVIWLVVASTAVALILNGSKGVPSNASSYARLLDACSRLGVPLSDASGWAIWGWALAASVALPLLLLAPYSLLSWADPFYRERFFGMFHLPAPARSLSLTESSVSDFAPSGH